MPPTENIVCGKAHPVKLRRQRDISVHSEKDMVDKGRLVFELRDDLRIAAENEIQIPFLKFLLKIDSAVLAKLYPDSGIFFGKFSQYRSQYIAIQKVSPAKPESSGLKSSQILDLAREILLEAQYALQSVDVILTGFCQGERSAAPVEELGADGFFHPFHGNAEGRLAHVEMFRCGGKTAVLIYLINIFHVLFHSYLRLSSTRSNFYISHTEAN
jgi:hypothetical protein